MSRYWKFLDTNISLGYKNSIADRVVYEKVDRSAEFYIFAGEWFLYRKSIV